MFGENTARTHALMRASEQNSSSSKKSLLNKRYCPILDGIWTGLSLHVKNTCRLANRNRLNVESKTLGLGLLFSEEANWPQKKGISQK